MDEKLTARELALYYGASAIVKHTGPDTFPYFEDGKKYPISGGMLREYKNGGIVVLPILRPLFDMTEDEKNHPIWEGETTFSDFAGMVHCAAPVFAWLLSRHFDLFGWIGKGLAIGATKKEALP